jgi:hypothetical protein
MNKIFVRSFVKMLQTNLLSNNLRPTYSQDLGVLPLIFPFSHKFSISIQLQKGKIIFKLKCG